MNLFEATIQDIESFGAEFDQTMDRLGVISEYNESTLSINQKKALLNERTREITLMEALDLIEEAKEEAGEKTEKEIAVAQKASKSYFTKVSEAIGGLTDDRYTKALKKAQKLCASNPALGKQKVEYKDYSSEAKEIEKAMAKMDKLLARCQSKKECTKEQADEAAKIIDDTNKQRNRLKPKTVTVPFNSCLKILEASIKTMNDDVARKKSPKLYASKDAVNGMDSENGQRYSRIVQNRVRLDKEHSAVNMRMMSSLRDAIRHIGKGNTVNESVLEGTEDYTSVEEDAMNEYVELTESEFDPDFSATDELDTVVESLQMEGNTMFNYDNNLYGESALDDEDRAIADSILQEAMEEAGLDEFLESGETEIDVDGILQEAMEEAGLVSDDEYEESVDSLLDNFADYV